MALVTVSNWICECFDEESSPSANDLSENWTLEIRVLHFVIILYT